MTPPERLTPPEAAAIAGVAGAAGDSVGRKVFSDQVLRTTISALRFD